MGNTKQRTAEPILSSSWSIIAPSESCHCSTISRLPQPMQVEQRATNLHLEQEARSNMWAAGRPSENNETVSVYPGNGYQGKTACTILQPTEMQIEGRCMPTIF